jgi:hypothetical protein
MDFLGAGDGDAVGRNRLSMLNTRSNMTDLAAPRVAAVMQLA